MTLEERIQRLEDIEEIRYLQAKYQRCLDTRDFDGIGECFDENVRTEYGNGAMAYDGRDAAIGFLANCMLLNMPSTHFIHGGEIDIVDPTHAKAKWYLEDFLIIEVIDSDEHGAAVYNNEYIKKDGRWFISKIGYIRCFEYKEKRAYDVKDVAMKTYLDEVANADPASFGPYGQYFQTQVLGKKIK